jgi:hypothetical protein
MAHHGAQLLDVRREPLRLGLVSPSHAETLAQHGSGCNVCDIVAIG